MAQPFRAFVFLGGLNRAFRCKSAVVLPLAATPFGLFAAIPGPVILDFPKCDLSAQVGERVPNFPGPAAGLPPLAKLAHNQPNIPTINIYKRL